MSFKTMYGDTISSEAFDNYIENLTGRFYKILPLREEECPSLPVYLEKFQAELLGTQKLVLELQNDANVMRLCSILQFLIDNPDLTVKTVKTEVFEAIDVCKKIYRTYNLISSGGDGDGN